MYMAFSTEDELRLFLTNKGDWKAWLKKQKVYGDRISVNGVVKTDNEIKAIMKGVK